MSYEDADAQILTRVARRQFQESRKLFHQAHQKGMESFGAQAINEHLREFGEAIEQERRAFEMQREAIELQRQANALREKFIAKLKAASNE